MNEELLIGTSPDGVLRLTMNRPAVHNAFDDAQVQRLLAALDQATTDDSVRIVVIASVGGSFSAGADINYMRRMGGNTHEQNLADSRRIALLMKTLNFLPKPTIARVQGAAMGGGVGLVSCCDFAIGTPRTRIALSEVRLGLAPATIAPYVVNTVGEKAARQLFLHGGTIDARTASHLGFLYDVVEEDQLDARIDALISALLMGSPAGTRAAKKLAIDVSRERINEGMIEETVRLLAELRGSDEGKEGLSAFLEKRTARWVIDR